MIYVFHLSILFFSTPSDIFIYVIAFLYVLVSYRLIRSKNIYFSWPCVQWSIGLINSPSIQHQGRWLCQCRWLLEKSAVYRVIHDQVNHGIFYLIYPVHGVSCSLNAGNTSLSSEYIYSQSCHTGHLYITNHCL
jgi:hypothetical protein